MGAVNHKSLYQSPREKRIGAALAKPDVDEDQAEAYIRETLAEIRARWSATEERKRRRWSCGAEVETRVIHSGYARHGVRQLTAE